MSEPARPRATLRWGRAAGLALLLAVPVTWAPAQSGTQTAPARDHHDHDAAHDATSSHPFDDVERWVKVFEAPDRAAWQKPAELPGALGVEPGMHVADIGAGTGYFVPHFSKAVGPAGRIYAVDTEPKMVAYMAQRFEKEKLGNAVAMQGTPDNPGLPDKALDLIFICDTYHHIDDRVDYVRRLERALKPGGRLVIVDFHKRELPVGPPLEHKLAREQVVEELAEAGWVMAGERDLLPHQYVLIFTPHRPG